MTSPRQFHKARQVWRFLRGSRTWFLLSILSAGVAALADMVIPQIVRAAVDNVLGGKAPEFPSWILRAVDRLGSGGTYGFAYLRNHLWILAAVVLATAFAKVLAQYANRVSNTLGAETLVKAIRDTLYTHLARLPFSWHTAHKTGDLIQRCTSDVETVKHFVSEQLVSVFRIVLMVSLSVVFMFSMDTRLSLVALAPVPIVVAYSFIFHRRIGAAFEKCENSEGKLSAMVQENLTGVRVVRSFGRERYEKDRFEAFNAEYTNQWVRLGKILSAFWCSSDALSGVQILLVIVFGAVFCVRGGLDAGEYIAFVSYNTMLVWPVRQLGRMIAEMSRADVAVGRILEITDAAEERDEPDAAEPDLSGDIAFEHVSFAYGDGPDALHDVSFRMKGGSTLGILGGTGSGKSTLVQLLDRLYDLPADGSRGRISVGGTDLRRIRAGHLRRNTGFVLQEPYLFSRTLSENIAIAAPDAPEAELREAVRAASLEKTVAEFPDGLATQVGERGVTLSGGQKQRVAIARALIRKTPVMVFDDSLSAVDTETDAAIRGELEKRFGQASILLISHRVSTLAKADWILVLDKGRVAEQGAPEDLRHSGGLYQKVYEAQHLEAAS